jgi:hypothetical protein
VQIDILKGLIKEQKKKFWADIGARMGKSGAGCEKAAKRENVPMY